MLLSLRVIALGFGRCVGFVAFVGACGLAPENETENDDDIDADLALACAFDDVPFSATGAVLQAVSEDACARLEREPVEVRRGTTWRATRLIVHAGGSTFDSEATNVELAYENTHHNCRDVVAGELDGAALSLAIDGVGDDPSVCFEPSSSAWVLRLAVDGREWLLRPR